MIDKNPENTLTLQEIDKQILKENINFKYTLSDAILFLLYSDRNPIKGKIKQHKEIFLALNLVLDKMPFQSISFKKHKFGPYSEEVEHTIDQLVFLNHLQTSGGDKRSNQFSISISPSGMNYIKDKFNGLPNDVKMNLGKSREKWDTHTPQGILNLVYTHYPEYLENSVLKNRHPRLDWDDDEQVP